MAEPPAPRRLVLLLTSPRVAPGLLSRDAWRALESASLLSARAADEPLVIALTDAGMPVTHLGDPGAPDLARALVDLAAGQVVVWLGSADGDPGLSDALASEVSRLPDPPEIEVVVGSWDVPGALLLDVVAVMDRLRSPGGCPWDAEQTHESLAPFLIEETYEVLEAIETGDPAQIADELGDVLLQVAFHARVAEEAVEAGRQGFDIDDVAAGLVAKLVRRHPHVFADGSASTPAEVEHAWERIKAEERATAAPGGAAGEDLLRGIPASLPALLAAQKVLSRLERRGGLAFTVASGSVGGELLAVVARAQAQGLSAEIELARAVRALADPGLPGLDPGTTQDDGDVDS